MGECFYPNICGADKEIADLRAKLKQAEQRIEEGIGVSMLKDKDRLRLQGERDQAEDRVRRLEDLLRQWHESWQRGDDGDYLDAPTCAALNPPSPEAQG